MHTTHLDKINSLNPGYDHWEIIRISAFYEFPWDFTRSLEMALFRTFAVPSISSILYKSREFEKRTQKRYDDTDLILSEILENGLQSERAKAAIEKLNFIHAHFKITNDDYLYVLSTFVFEPMRWNDKYGYRKLSDNEIKAGFKIWSEIGEAMHIKNIPTTVEEFEQFNIDYEKKNLVYAESNYLVSSYTIDMFLSWLLPKPLFFIGRPFICAVMDEPLLKAVGFKKPNFFVQSLTDGFFASRKFILRFFPDRKKPHLHTKLPRKETYPKGYKVDELGSKPYKQSITPLSD